MPKTLTKKTLTKRPPTKAAPTKKATPSSAYERNHLPSRGGCKHRGPCFRVLLFNSKEGDYDGNDTYHFMDEAGAVIFGMRSSRQQQCRARVFGPDKKLIVAFEPRTYDVKAAQHALTDNNEWYVLHKEVWDTVNQAAREQEAKPTVKRRLKK